MKIEITEAFRAYPDGVTDRLFQAGEIVEDLPDEFAQIVVYKGLARATGPVPVPEPTHLGEPVE